MDVHTFPNTSHMACPTKANCRCAISRGKNVAKYIRLIVPLEHIRISLVYSSCIMGVHVIFQCYGGYAMSRLMFLNSAGSNSNLAESIELTTNYVNSSLYSVQGPVWYQNNPTQSSP